MRGLHCTLFASFLSAIPMAIRAPKPPIAEFTVSNIRIEDLQRVSEDTVYNYLPMNIGDHFTPARLREAIRALYATGFFAKIRQINLVGNERYSRESLQGDIEKLRSFLTGTGTTRARSSSSAQRYHSPIHDS